MGKGDKKTKRGKIIQGSYGRKRLRKKDKAFKPEAIKKSEKIDVVEKTKAPISKETPEITKPKADTKIVKKTATKKTIKAEKPETEVKEKKTTVKKKTTKVVKEKEEPKAEKAKTVKKVVAKKPKVKKKEEKEPIKKEE